MGWITSRLSWAPHGSSKNPRWGYCLRKCSLPPQRRKSPVGLSHILLDAKESNLTPISYFFDFLYFVRSFIWNLNLQTVISSLCYKQQESLPPFCSTVIKASRRIKHIEGWKNPRRYKTFAIRAKWSWNWIIVLLMDWAENTPQST